MAIAWFICPYVRRVDPSRAIRYPAMDDFTAAVVADGGAWAETEVLGNAALCKVRASAATLATIGAAVSFTTIPLHTVLTDTLGDLTAGQRTAIANKLQALGYPLAEIRTVMPSGGWGAITLGQVLRFIARRRLTPRYDRGADTITLDGVQVTPKSVDLVAAEVV